MASNLRVDNIQPSTGTGIGIGTANGSVTFNADVTGGLNVTTGSVGVGTDNPYGKLHIGNSPEDVVNDVDTTNTSLIIKQSTNNRDDGIYIERGGERKGYYMWLNPGGGAGDGLTFSRNNAGTYSNALILDRNADAHFGGNAVFASGNGIDFSATSDAAGMTSELLDDYEEGTWTPTYLAASGDITSAINQGVYIKIGNAVHFSFRLGSTMTSFTGVSGQVKLSGLPFTVGSSTQQRVGGGSIDEMYRWPTNFANFRGYPEAGTTAIGFHIMNPNASSYENLEVGDMNTGTNQNIIAMSGWYTTTDF